VFEQQRPTAAVTLRTIPNPPDHPTPLSLRETILVADPSSLLLYPEGETSTLFGTFVFPLNPRLSVKARSSTHVTPSAFDFFPLFILAKVYPPQLTPREV
jgi:hypothetical protein